MAVDIRAVIDVGTNSVKLLVAEVSETAVLPLYESSQQTRLGQGFYESHILQPGAIRETARSVAEFATKAKELRASSVRVIGTSAARDAQNKHELIEAVRVACGLKVQVITGDVEADWAFRGVTSDERFAKARVLVMDVGGGSTEFIVGFSQRRVFAQSFSLGSVRLLEKIELSDPPTVAELRGCESIIDKLIEQEIRPQVAPFLSDAAVQLIGTGGTSTILARIELQQEVFDRGKIEQTILPYERIRQEKERLWSLPLAERRHIIGLPANRADVILPGVLIYERVMEAFDLRGLHVSTRGIRFAALME